MKKILSSVRAQCLLIGTLLHLFVSPDIQAFPEMVRHGYANCTSCHVSPSGGGVLTTYGRELSKEILSTWSGEREHLPLYGAVELPKPLRLGGDIRTVQIYKDTPEVREGRYFLMQADIEAAWVTEQFTAVATVGRDPGSPYTQDDDEWLSRRHYILLPFASNMSVRAGRFLRNYGLMIPDHTSEIRGGLNWGQGTETYNAEFNVQEENYAISITGVGGRPDDEDVVSEKGFAARASRFFMSKFKLGANYFYGRTTDQVGRELYGLDWSLGFNERTYWLGEFDWVRTAPQGQPLNEGWVSYNRFGYEILKGFDLYLVHEARKSDRRRSELDSNRYGPGLQWSPRPHLILSGQWQKQIRYITSRKATDSAWLVFHFYI